MRRAVDLGLSRRSSDERYYYLSIDEKAVHKGHDYTCTLYEVRSISILSDEQSGVVLEVVDDRSEDSVDELCQIALTEEQRNEVRTVCTDMRQPYTRTSYAVQVSRAQTHTFPMLCIVTTTFI